MPEKVNPSITPEFFAEANCAEVETGFMYPEEGDILHETLAKMVCANCVVVNECKTLALITKEPFGVWGGLTAHERQNIRYKINREHRRRERN